YCSAGTTSRVTFRNVGTTDIGFVNGDCNPASGNTVTCGNIGVTRTSGGGTAALDGNDATMEPGTTSDLIDTACTTGGTPRTCVYRITPPSGRSVVATVSCTG
ncbi:MAG: hypothetical protein HYS80_00170, partial [Candidatus Aenigmarchaeota archaeon]|nr:hypothetical protein [Candidatus Aenigmarchaeota archaeon]